MVPHSLNNCTLRYLYNLQYNSTQVYNSKCKGKNARPINNPKVWHCQNASNVPSTSKTVTKTSHHVLYQAIW